MPSAQSIHDRVAPAQFARPLPTHTSESFTTQATRFLFGATNSNAVNAVFDNIRLDTAVMPAP
jgi:hypothetical protein